MSPRILSGNAAKAVGRPGFKRKIPAGGRVSKDKASRFSVRRLMASNPADARLNPDPNAILGFTDLGSSVPNVNAAPNPEIVRQPQFGAVRKNATETHKNVRRTSGANRRIRKTNS
jgi:hypothetical protein